VQVELVGYSLVVCIVAVFVIIDVQTVFLTRCAGMFAGYSYKIYIRCLLVTGIEPKSKGSLRSVAFLLFYSLQKYNNNTYVPKAYYRTSFRE
jgi:hypothetical protein